MKYITREKERLEEFKIKRKYVNISLSNTKKEKFWFIKNYIQRFFL